jgi:hypothetical protein
MYDYDTVSFVYAKTQIIVKYQLEQLCQRSDPEEIGSDTSLSLHFSDST